MSDERIIVGLDIGTTKICTVIGEVAKDGVLDIIGEGTVPSDGLRKGVVVNLERTIVAVKQSVADAQRMAGVEVRSAWVGVAGSHLKAMTSHGMAAIRRGQEVTRSDIERTIENAKAVPLEQNMEVLHVIPQEYVVDGNDGIKDPEGMSGVRLEADFHIITAQTNAINNVNKCIRRGGLEIADLILEPLASSLAVLSDEEKEAGVCLIDIGGGTTDIAIFYDNIIRHTAVIPFGGNIVTNDIKQGLMVLPQQAEQLKTKFGKAIAEEASPNEVVSIPGIRNRAVKGISVKNLSNIIQARMEEIIELIHTEIITSGYESKIAGGIVITGGGSQLQYCKQLFEFMTGMDCRIGYPNEHLGKSKIEAVKSPMYSTSVGLVLTGFRAIDERENRYWQNKEVNKNRVRRDRAGGDFFRKIIDRTKGLLIDDVDDKEDY